MKLRRTLWSLVAVAQSSSEVFFEDTSVRLSRRTDGKKIFGRNDFYIDLTLIITVRKPVTWHDVQKKVLSGGRAVIVLPARTEIHFLTTKKRVSVTSFTFGNPFLPYDGTPLVPPLRAPFLVTQGYFGAASHATTAALDFSCAEGEPVYAARDGVVWRIVSEFHEQCDNLGDPGACFEANQLANKVYVAHCDGTSGVYVHFGGPHLIQVEVGQVVRARVDVLGPCGTTGISTGPHLHFQVDQTRFSSDDDDDDVLKATTVETLVDDKCDGSPAFRPQKGQRWDVDQCPGGFYARCPTSSSAKRNGKRERRSAFAGWNLVLLDFGAFIILAGLAVLVLVGNVRRHRQTPPFLTTNLIVVVLTWFTACTEIPLVLEYRRHLAYDAWAFSAATLCCTFFFHLGVGAFQEVDPFAVPGLLFSVPSLDGANVVLPFDQRSNIHGFPDDRLAAYSVVRLFLLDTPQLILKLIVYQANVGYSAFACVSAVGSILTIGILANRFLVLLRVSDDDDDRPKKKRCLCRQETKHDLVIDLPVVPYPAEGRPDLLYDDYDDDDDDDDDVSSFSEVSNSSV